MTKIDLIENLEAERLRRGMTERAWVAYMNTSLSYWIGLRNRNRRLGFKLVRTAMNKCPDIFSGVDWDIFFGPCVGGVPTNGKGEE